MSAPMTVTCLVRLRVSLGARDASLLDAAVQLCQRRLYVVLTGDWTLLSMAQVERRLQFVYQRAASKRPDLDVRVVLPSEHSEVASGVAEIDSILGNPKEEDDLATVNALRTSLGLPPLSFVALAADVPVSSAAHVAVDGPDNGGGVPSAVFEHVCVGGTFDYMHIGHKVLLSLAAHVTSRRLVCAVSDAPLLKKKTLRELMQPVRLRIALVDDFLRSIKPTIHFDLSPLQDPFGPAIVDGALQSILVSEETRKVRGRFGGED